MSDLVDEFGHERTGIKWRIGQTGDRTVTVSDSSIVFDLVDSHDSTLASFSMPSERIGELLRPHLSVFVELRLDGSLSLETEFSSALFPQQTTTDILELARQTLAPEMLQDEPDAKEHLTTLRQRLTEALTLVDRTLADLDNLES